jgi:flavin reductase (DIM6/NTAB) family NADH-FMN oxidoreductase RutF
MMVKPPRVAAAPVALECIHHLTVELPSSNDSPNLVVFGMVVGIHIDESVIVDGMIDVARFKPLGRLGYMDYTVVDAPFTMMRPD